MRDKARTGTGGSRSGKQDSGARAQEVWWREDCCGGGSTKSCRAFLPDHGKELGFGFYPQHNGRAVLEEGP